MNKKFIAKLLVLAMMVAMVPAVVVSASADSNGNYGYYSVSVDTTVRVNEPISSDGTIEVKVVGGTASVTLGTKAVESLADLAKNGEIVLEIKADGANKVDVSIPAKALATVAEKTGADLTIKSDVATVTIPNEALTTELGNSGNLSISVQATGSSVNFSIQASGKALKNIKGLKVEF